MNQILVTKIKKNYKMLFKIQFVLSICIIMFLGIFYFLENKKDKDLEKISEVLNKNIEISKMYNVENVSLEKNLYFCEIEIEKLGISYFVFNELNEELLKIGPCKFYGKNIGDNTNICIAGHNYNDSRFFSNLFKMEIGEKIKIIDLDKKEYVYEIFDIYETEENDVDSVIKKKRAFELTLLTCNNSNGKRLIIKASLIE